MTEEALPRPASLQLQVVLGTALGGMADPVVEAYVNPDAALAGALTWAARSATAAADKYESAVRLQSMLGQVSVLAAGRDPADARSGFNSCSLFRRHFLFYGPSRCRSGSYKLVYSPPALAPGRGFDSRPSVESCVVAYFLFLLLCSPKASFLDGFLARLQYSLQLLHAHLHRAVLTLCASSNARLAHTNFCA